MSRSERLLALLQFLRNRRRPATAAELARAFNVSERTVYRDLDSLRAQGAGIEGAPGFGYILGADHFLPPLMFSPLEADAVALGLRFVLQRADPLLADAARAAAAKIAAVVPPDVEQSARLNGLAVAPAGNATPMLARVREAIEKARKLTMDYTDAEGRRTTRTIWPIVLGFFDETEVVAGWCELRNDFRHFSLAGIRRAKVSDQSLPKPHRILLAEWQLQNKEVTF